MRSGWVSTLVPRSAWAVSAADVRFRTSGRPAPTPMPYSPWARNSRREQQPRSTCLRDIQNLIDRPRNHESTKPNMFFFVFSCFRGRSLTDLVLGRAQNQIQQLPQRLLELVAGLNVRRPELADRKSVV